MAIEIVDLPIYPWKMVDLSIVMWQFTRPGIFPMELSAMGHRFSCLPLIEISGEKDDHLGWSVW